MTDEQIKMLVKLTGEEARMLLEEKEYSLYRDIQDEMVKLVRNYGVQLSLNCLRFLYYGNGYVRESGRYSSAEAPF